MTDINPNSEPIDLTPYLEDLPALLVPVTVGGRTFPVGLEIHGRDGGDTYNIRYEVVGGPSIVMEGWREPIGRAVLAAVEQVTGTEGSSDWQHDLSRSAGGCSSTTRHGGILPSSAHPSRRTYCVPSGK